MAAAPVPAPPGATPPSSSGGGGGAPGAAMAPRPGPNPQLQQASQGVITVVQILRGIAQSFPATAPFVQQINNLMREVQVAMMKDMQPSPPQAPPVNG